MWSQGGGRGEGAGWGWGAVCVSSALKRNKRTHGGSSQAGFSVSLTVVASELQLSPASTVSQTRNSCSALSPPLYLWRGKDALPLMCFLYCMSTLNDCRVKGSEGKYHLRPTGFYF